MINNNDVKSLAHTKWNSFSKLRTNDKLPITSKLAIQSGILSANYEQTTSYQLQASLHWFVLVLQVPYSICTKI